MKPIDPKAANVALGGHVRQMREARLASDPSFSLRKVAMRCGVTPAFLSRFERGDVLPPGERVLVLLAMAGKISEDLRAAILARPRLFAGLIRAIRSVPDQAVLRIVRDVRDGDW